MKKVWILSFLLVAVWGSFLLLEGCSKKDKPAFLPANPLTFTIPSGFPQPVYDFASNPLSEEGFQLGKKLFYEGRLSIDGNFPCASCHQPEAAYTTYEHDRSHGYNHAHTLRNAPGLFNLAWYPVFNQDGGGRSLRGVSIAHINARDEMASSISEIVARLQNDSAYPSRFQAAFGTPEVNGDRVLKAIDQFLVSLVSANAKYDKVKRGETSFTSQESSGYAVFAAKCASCHKEPLFTDFSFRNTGLPIDPLLNDRGRIRVTGNPDDSLKFRVPSLRNLVFTSYYGHDGRFNHFRNMSQHYRTGITPSPSVDPLVRNGISMTDTEEASLAAFLRTLTDSSFFTNPRFRN